MMIKTQPRIRTLLYILGSLMLLTIAFSVGASWGYSHRPEVEKVLSVAHKEPQVETTADFDSFWKAWNILKEKSIYAKNVSDQDKVWGAVSGLASSMGDPYTVFFPPDENKLFNDEIHGSFGGIGAEIGIKDKTLTIISPLKDTPAAKAGLKAGDKILKIDKTDSTNMTIDKAINLIRGPKGSVVILTIIRPGERSTREVPVTRDDIAVPTIDTQVKNDVFIISLYSFSENSDTLFKNALEQFANSGKHKLILDLRGNPGGYLEAAVNIGSWFIDEGKPIVIEDFGNNQKQVIYRSHGPRLFDDKLQFIVLVDGGSASASEILAGALSEHNIATLVGEKTFGKGSVQELIPITDTTSLKVTVAKWLTPKGISISEHGLDPDVNVPFTLKDADNKLDPQMDKAMQILEAKP